MSLKENFFKNIVPLRRLFVWGNVVLFLLMAAAMGLDQVRGWKSYQKEFKAKEITRIKSKLEAAQSDEEKQLALSELHQAKGLKLEIRQLWLQRLNGVDRCITCHLGYDSLTNASLSTEYTEQPYSAPASGPSYEIHKMHSFEKFGCVSCHGGQGLATEKKAAHGEVAHWEAPLLKGALIQASCKKCHDNLTELKVGDQVYPTEVIRAQGLIRDNGCMGCHQISGEGGPVSVDFKEETSAKPLSRIDFSNTGLSHEEANLSNWIKFHLTHDPADLVPGDPEGLFNTEPIAPSAMPSFNLPENDATAITAFILGLNRNNIPPEFLTLRPATPKPTSYNSQENGRLVYESYGCAGCHGADARGGIRNFNSLNDVTPNLRRAVATYTRTELADKISAGVPIVARNSPHGPNPPLYMPPWKDKIKGKELDDLISYLMSIKEQ